MEQLSLAQRLQEISVAPQASPGAERELECVTGMPFVMLTAVCMVADCT